MSGIPVLDISRFDDVEQRTSFLRDFDSAYREWGFAGITNHGIDTEKFLAALAAAEQFFALPDSKKKAYSLPAGSARGYTAFGIEKAKDSKHTDLKEFFHIGRHVHGAEHLPENIWPEEIPAFQIAFNTIYTELDRLANKILQVIALCLSLPQEYFNDKVDRGDTILRVLHYPPIEDGEVPNLRAAAHEDINLITLLAGSEQDGLEVLSRKGDWVPISMIHGTIICNVGDMLQRLTNSRMPSTTHRVVNPDGDLARTSRYSIPFFMHPNPEMSLDSLDQCIDEDNPALFSPITAGEYLEQRLREIGLKK